MAVLKNQSLPLFLLFLIVLLITIHFSSCESIEEINEGSEEQEIAESVIMRRDPCVGKRCAHGMECVLINEEPTCRCVKECAENSDMRRRVCSNHNTTWQSDCHLYRHRCLCRQGSSEDCINDHKTMRINYYGECQEIGSCEPDVLIDFPRRMKEWLYQVMGTKIKKPADHPMSTDHQPSTDHPMSTDHQPSTDHQLSTDHPMSTDHDQQDEVAGKWIDAVIWKFCDLDRHPHDRKVSTDELFPLRAPFLAMETCIGTFLNQNCDPNKDGQISLIEWGQCLQVPEGEMEDKCNDFVKLSSSSKTG